MCPAVLLSRNFATTTITFKTCRAKIQHCYVAVLYYENEAQIKMRLLKFETCPFVIDS
jgi:hypothetical protein